MEIITLIKANIKYKKGAFKSIAILMFIIALAMTTIISTTDNIQENLNKSLESTDACDLMTFMSDRTLTDELRQKVEANPNVERTKDIAALSFTDTKLDDQQIVHFVLYAKESDQYQVYNEKEDELLSDTPKLSAGEVYVPISFKSLFDCQIGSRVTFSYINGEEEFFVKGFIEEPYFGAYVMEAKVIFMSEADFNRLNDAYSLLKPEYASLATRFRLFLIYQSKDSVLTIPELKRSLNESAELIDYASQTKSIEEVKKYTTIFTDVFGGMLTAFVVLLLVILLIVMGHSISTGIEMEYTNLGIMKSIGFSKGKIRKILCLQYFLAEILGAVTGFLAAIFCVQLLGSVFQPITGIISTSDLASLKCIGILIAILIICNLFVFLKTRKIAKISPVRAITGGHNEIYFDNRLRVTLSQKALAWKLTFRQLTTGMKQYISLIIISAILVYFMMAITTLATCMTPEALTENFGATVSDITVKINGNFSMAQKSEIAESISAVSELDSIYYMQGNHYTLDGYEYYGVAYDDPSMMKSIVEGRAPLYENEIVITEIVAEELNKTIGQKIKVKFEDKSFDYIITGYNQTTKDAGRCFSLSFDALSKLTEIAPSRAFIRLNDATSAVAVVDMLNTRFSGVLEAEETDGGGLVGLIQTSLDVVSAIIYLVSGLFSLIVIQMVCGKTFIKEKHDIGIYKAVGFTSMSLRLQFTLRFVLIALGGSLIGTIIYLLVNDQLMSKLFYSMGIYNFVTEYQVITFAFPLAFISVCFFLFSLYSTRKVRNVSVRDMIVE